MAAGWAEIKKSIDKDVDINFDDLSDLKLMTAHVTEKGNSYGLVGLPGEDNVVKLSDFVNVVKKLRDYLAETHGVADKVLDLAIHDDQPIVPTDSNEQTTMERYGLMKVVGKHQSSFGTEIKTFSFVDKDADKIIAAVLTHNSSGSMSSRLRPEENVYLSSDATRILEAVEAARASFEDK